MQQLRLQRHGAHGCAMLGKSVMRLNEVMQFEFLHVRQRAGRQGAQSTVQHDRAEDDMLQQIAGLRVVKAGGTNGVRLNLPDVVQQRAGGDEIAVAPHGLGGVACDRGDFDHMQQEPADERVVTARGAGGALESRTELVVGKEQIHRAAQRCGRDLAAPLLDLRPE